MKNTRNGNYMGKHAKPFPINLFKRELTVQI